ncbi:hypothetical protein [Streptomyces sp. NPDC006638]|uniref:hypothetical protein n=1 Tax=Streptomyces sp. NPDC006638 TaxID=3157183 RepID=UPI0033AC87B9
MYKTMSHREVTSHSNTLDDAVRSARGAWWNGSDGRTFIVVNPSGSTVAHIKRGVATIG